MSNQSGVQLYTQSMNGLINIDNADTIQVFELDAEIINVDDLTVNNLLTVPNISNTTIGTITQTGTNIITQTGTGTNIFKNTEFSGNVLIDGDLTLTGILDYDVLDIDCENLIVQNDASLNNINISGNLRVQQKSIFIGDVSMNNLVVQNDTSLNDVNISGNLRVEQKSIFIGDVSMNNLVVQNDTSLNDVYVSGDLQVDNVLQIFDGTGSIVGVSQPTNTKHQLLAGTTFTVKANYNIDFTITVVCPIAFNHEGVNNGGVNDTLTKLNSYTISIYKNGVFLQNANTSSENNAIPTPSHKFFFNNTGNFTYNKYFTTLTNTFTINHIGSPTDTLYEVFYTFNWTTTQVLVTNTSIGFYLNANTTFFTSTGVATGTTPALGTFNYANNWTAPSFNTVYNVYSPVFTPNTNLFENVYQITCDQITTNNLIATDSSINNLTTNNLTTDYLYVNELLDVDNVSTFDPTIQLQEFIFGKTSYTTGLFVGSQTLIYSFDVRGGNRPRTLTIDYSTPLSLTESGTVGIPQTGLRSTINSATLSLYREGILVSTTTGTKTNTTDPRYNITSAGSYNYTQFVNIITGSITHVETSPATRTYELKISLNNTRTNSGGTYGYVANTLTTGITKSANVNNLETFTNYSVGAYTVTVANNTPIYSTDTGTLTNSTLISNAIYNKVLFNKLVFITTTPYTLISTNSYYFIQKASGVQINLPYLDNNYTGFIVNIRKAPPTRNSDTITINASVNGCLYYHNNMTPTPAHIDYNNAVGWILIYGGSGNWYDLNVY